MPACFCQWWWLVPGCCDHTAAPPIDTHWCSGNLPQSNTWSSTKENRDKMANITVFRPKVVFCYNFFITFQGYLLNHNVCERKGFKCWKRCRLEQDGSATPSCKCVLCVYMYVQLCVCIEEVHVPWLVWPVHVPSLFYTPIWYQISHNPSLWCHQPL